jgi:HSP20 family protein
MANIARQNLFSDPLDELFRGFFARPLSFEAANVPQFRMDVTENENAYRVRADLPGVKKDDIAVTVEHDTVTVNAEIRAHKEAQNGERVVRSERYIGKLSRSFALGQDVDEAGAEARFNDGVLELVLPKKAAAARRRLTVN